MRQPTSSPLEVEPVLEVLLVQGVAGNVQEGDILHLGQPRDTPQYL